MAIRGPVARKIPSPAALRESVAKNATWPLLLTGATTGCDSTLKRSNAPPPGAGCPTVTITATVAARTVTGASARTSATQASAVPGSRIIAPEYREMVKSGQ